MIFENKQYVLATKTFPLEFIDENMNRTNYIENSLVYDTKEQAEDEIKTLDELDEFRTLEVNIRYEL